MRFLSYGGAEILLLVSMMLCYPPGMLQFAILIAQRLFRKPCAESSAAEQIAHSISTGKEPGMEKTQGSSSVLSLGPGSRGDHPYDRTLHKAATPRLQVTFSPHLH